MRRVRVRNIAVALATVGCMGALSTPAFAQVRFIGSTTGCFFVGSAPANCSATGTSGSSVGGLTYTGSTFDASSNKADGLFTLGSTGTAPNINNLGSFTLKDGTFDYTGQKFALFLSFTRPTDADGNNRYGAIVTGNLTNSTSGNVFINFTDATRTFTFADGTVLRNFGVNDLSINDQTTGSTGATVAVTGQGFASPATVPEPSSMALLGTGLVGLVPMIRRKRIK